ncbi:polysaccharide deacetylase family protein [Thermoanaerobacterium sp. PSU-2]|jgi:polysaccharide deacetylase family sporulation protein PdaB|uniref:polysaccharide deacetylase family protein n=1 Tax=Thermoanaerobacterium sp. PSU-2 TaxID=1930849 RepID=UPI000A162541|nr:polysaccharide deacetylase family protein [Thermoanaerobacterium sp. PSU-2]
MMTLIKSKKSAILLFLLLVIIGFTLFYGKSLFVKHNSASSVKSAKIVSKIKTKKTSNKPITTVVATTEYPSKSSTSKITSIISSNAIPDNDILSLVDRSNRNELFESPIPLNTPIFSSNKKAKKLLALTFDDGPSKEFTKKYVDVLKSLNIKATFFVVGKMAEKNPNLLKYIAENGDEIGIHSYSHKYMPLMPPEQMIDEFYKTQAIVVNVAGVKPDLFRPPYGAFNNTLVKISNALGLHVVLWTVDPDDWKRPGIPNIINTIVSKSSSGSIILMHEGNSETLAALPQIITKLRSKGYSFVTVSELMKAYQ